MNVPTATALWRMGSAQLAAAIREGHVSSREVVEAHLERIAGVNPAINAVPVVLAERALEDATLADRRLASGGDLPPLLGVPFTVKANIDMAGTPTTHGMAALSTADPGIDAPVVERLRAAGGIPLGRTNLPDFAIGWHTDSELWGATLNPWDATRTPGGSSGGEAAALATGMSPLGIGNDTGGSLRWPAQCCGVATLKPTLGRVPAATTIEPRDLPIGNQLMGVNGPMARQVADLRLALKVIAGPTWRDPWSVPAPLRGPDPARPVRVAMVRDPAGMGTAPQVRDGVETAAAALSEAGYLIEELEPPSVEAAARVWLDISIPPLRAGWDLWSAQVREPMKRWVLAFFEAAGEPDPAASIQCFIDRQAILRAWGELQESRPLVLAPVAGIPPFEVGRHRSAVEVAGIIRAMRMAVAVNALGLPAVAVPVGIGSGLPQVVQVVGPRFREDLCLDAAQAIEERLAAITPIDPR
ncbi:MAG TPA: amidase [Candidatus Limnocylindria bacterium]